MNKLSKIGLFISIVLILLGIGISTAAFAMGASPSRITEHFNARFHWGDDRLMDLGLDPGEMRDLEAVEEAVREWGAFPAEQGVIYGDKDWQASYPLVTRLEIRQRGGEVRVNVTESEDFLTVRSENGSLKHVSYHDNGNAQKLVIDARDGENYEIYVPVEWYFEKLDVEVRGGIFSGAQINAKEADVTVREGTAQVVQSYGEELELYCRKGMIEWTAGERAAAGIEAECEGGEITIVLADGTSVSDYSCDLECGNGVITLPELTLEGNEEREIDGDRAGFYMNLEAKDNGTIQVAE